MTEKLQTMTEKIQKINRKSQKKQFFVKIRGNYQQCIILNTGNNYSDVYVFGFQSVAFIHNSNIFTNI